MPLPIPIPMVGERGELFHVLAIDDSVIDRKIIERLLKISSYKGGDVLVWFGGFLHSRSKNIIPTLERLCSNNSGFWHQGS